MFCFVFLKNASHPLKTGHRSIVSVHKYSLIKHKLKKKGKEKTTLFFILQHSYIKIISFLRHGASLQAWAYWRKHEHAVWIKPAQRQTLKFLAFKWVNIENKIIPKHPLKKLKIFPVFNFCNFLEVYLYKSAHTCTWNATPRTLHLSVMLCSL